MRDSEELPTLLSGVNAEFLEHLFQQFLEQPDSVEPEWREFFDQLLNGDGDVPVAAARAAPPPGGRDAATRRPAR